MRVLLWTPVLASLVFASASAQTFLDGAQALAEATGQDGRSVVAGLPSGKFSRPGAKNPPDLRSFQNMYVKKQTFWGLPDFGFRLSTTEGEEEYLLAMMAVMDLVVLKNGKLPPIDHFHNLGLKAPPIQSHIFGRSRNGEYPMTYHLWFEIVLKVRILFR